MHQNPRPWWKTGFILILAIACIAVVHGCLFSPDDEKNPPPPDDNTPGRGTAKQLLETYFEQAYSTRDSILYAEMLDDEYSFYFLIEDADSLRDVLGPDNFWGRTLELESTGNLFRHPDVTGITLNIRVNNEAASTNEECLECTVVQTTVTLRVETVGDGTEPLIYTVDSPQTFYTRREAPPDTALWVIWRQYDEETPGL